MTPPSTLSRYAFTPTNTAVSATIIDEIPDQHAAERVVVARLRGQHAPDHGHRDDEASDEAVTQDQGEHGSTSFVELRASGS